MIKLYAVLRNSVHQCYVNGMYVKRLNQDSKFLLGVGLLYENLVGVGGSPEHGQNLYPRSTDASRVDLIEVIRQHFQPSFLLKLPYIFRVPYNRLSLLLTHI